MRCRNAIALIILFIVIRLSSIAGRLVRKSCCISSPFAFVPPDIQQLFSNSVFRGKAVLNIGLEEGLVRNASFQDIAMMLLVQAHQCFGSDRV